LDRHPNPIWSQLADDRLTACFIADGQHLPTWFFLPACLREPTLFKERWSNLPARGACK
jgi:N-acetylglucosamine-6-phosphate deacetylase